MRINLTSMYLAAKHVLPVMVRQHAAEGRGGAIVNIGSISGIRWTGVPYISYSVSKGAVIPLTPVADRVTCEIAPEARSTR